MKIYTIKVNKYKQAISTVLLRKYVKPCKVWELHQRCSNCCLSILHHGEIDAIIINCS